MLKIYIIYFFVYAIIGWILEVAYNGINADEYINCGVLNGPWCPIYGFAAISILILLRKVDTNSKIYLFVASMIITSLIELITGFILEKLFNKKWWDYSDKKFNIGGYICAEYSLLWGALCFILYETIHPMIAILVRSVPRKILIIVNIVIAIIFILDAISTINTILDINKKFKEIEESKEKLGEITTGIGERIANRGIDTAGKTVNKRKEFDQRSIEFKQNFQKQGEKRILKAFPNLIKDLEDRDYDFSDLE